MSSSPGFLSSVDDFYLTSHGLAVTETTNGIFDKTLWAKVNTSTVLSWMRADVANMLARNTPTWARHFARENSGTYNNQWMVLDTNRLEARAKATDPLLPGSFLVLEQIPGLVESADMTAHLNAERYWASYNIAYFPRIYNASGFGRQRPPWLFSHAKSPRALIFAQVQQTVSNFTALQAALRWNDWQNNPGPPPFRNPCYGVCARCDLNKPKSLNFDIEGGIDSKVSTAMRARSRFSFSAQNGPTRSHGLPAFDWARVGRAALPPPYRRVPLHDGSPSKWAFDWVEFSNSSKP